MESEERLMLERLRGQIDRLVSDAESEKGTAARMNKLILDRIEKVDSDFKDMFYGEDRKSGLIVDVDRLIQSNKIIQNNRRTIYLLCVSVGGLLVKELLKLIIK